MSRILMVDDDSALHLLIETQLKRLNYKVEHTYTGEECVTWMEQNGCDVDLILMDIEMPGRLSGADAALEIMRFCDIPIIFHSSHSQSDIVNKIEGIASYGYLVKGTEPIVMDATFKMAVRLGKQKADSIKNLRLLQTVFNMIDDPMTVHNISLNSMLIDCNDAYCRTTGHTRKEVIGKTSSNLKLWAHEHEQEEFIKLMNTQGKVDDFPHHYLTKNGDINKGYLSASIFTHEGMEYAVIRMRAHI